MAIKDCTCEKDMQLSTPPEQIIIPSPILKTDPKCPVHGDATLEAEEQSYQREAEADR